MLSPQRAEGPHDALPVVGRQVVQALAALGQALPRRLHGLPRRGQVGQGLLGLLSRARCQPPIPGEAVQRAGVALLGEPPRLELAGEPLLPAPQVRQPGARLSDLPLQSRPPPGRGLGLRPQGLV